MAGKTSKAMKRVAMLVAALLVAVCIAGCSTTPAGIASTAPAGTDAPKTSPAEASQQPAETEPAAQEPIKLQYSIFLQRGTPYVLPEEDAVTPEMSKKWIVTVTDYFYESGQNWSEKLKLFVAANTLPDLYQIPVTGVDTVTPYADKFYDLTSILADESKTPNLHQRVSQKQIEGCKAFSTGKNIYWPTGMSIDFSDPANQQKYTEDYLNAKSSAYTIYVREDILQKLGYKFTPMAQLESRMKSENYTKRLTYDDIKIEPEIKTMDDFENFLKAVKDLNLKAPDGTSVIAYGGMDPVWQVGGAFAFDFFRYIDGKACSFYGSPYAKDMFQTLNRWYREGLLDPDTYVYSNQSDKIAEKISSGKLACWNGAWVPNDVQVEKNLLTLIPEAAVRYITVPRYMDSVAPYIENVPMGGNQGLLINKDYKDLDNLIQYLDYLWSDEAVSLSLWGSESSGLWEVKDGKRQFKDSELYQAITTSTKTTANKDANYYGINGTAPCLVGLTTGTNNVLYEYRYNYPAVYTCRGEVKRLAGVDMQCVDGTCTSTPQGEAAASVNNFFWSNWDYHAKLALAEDDATFEKAWEEVKGKFDSSTQYAQAMEDMTKVFKQMIGQ